MSFDMKAHHDDLLFIPLGGSNEIGMNLNVYHYKGKYLLVDLGIGFADDYLPGVEVVVPDITFLQKHKDDIVGLILTHAHEDHLGAVPYLWPEIACPIYATPFTSAVLKGKLASSGVGKSAPIHEVKAGDKWEMTPFTIELVPLTHSIPEMQAVAITTDKGTIIHTGDWKLDDVPLVGPVSDEAGLERFGNEGVLAIVCDSTNVFVEGTSGSESGVREGLTEVIRKCPQRAIVTTFASNIARLESIILAGHEAGRKIVLAGRSLWRLVEAARESGYLQNIPELYTEKQYSDFAKDEVLIVCTGCQGEPRAALTKIARNEHPTIRLTPADTVIFSARVIPGNETRINWLQNKLVEAGIEVVTDREADIHVSGHPAQDELARMYQLVRPHISIPVHGERRHLHAHAKLAKSFQVPHALEASNGAVLKLCREQPSVIGQVASGYIVVDGTCLLPVDSPVIRTRRRLRDDGCVIVSLVIGATGRMVTLPRITAPGVFAPQEDEDLIESLCEEVEHAVENLKEGVSSQVVDQTVRSVVRRNIKRELGKKPVIEVQLIRI
jgi:ribonuclease J